MSSPTITAIAAMSRNGIIGNGGIIPWRLPSDLKRFKRLTMGCPVVMGRKTYESLGKPLPGRLNVVLSRSGGLKCPEGVLVCQTVSEALERAARGLGGDVSELFVVGGETLYRECVLNDGIIPCSKVYLTVIDAEAQGDARFPYDELVSDVHGWKMIDSEPHEDKQGQMHAQSELAGLQYTFGTYVRGK